MRLDEITSNVRSQLDQQEDLDVQIVDVNDVPEVGPTNRGVWHRIRNVYSVFADMKLSTKISSSAHLDTAALAYTYFIRAATVVFDELDAKYIDIQGDGLFGLFSGNGSAFNAVASAITIRTIVETDIADRLKGKRDTEWTLTVGVGMDRGTLLVRRLGIRGVKQNEVWVGKPVSMSSKLSSLAGNNELAVSPRVFREFNNASKLRRRVLLWSCGCDNGTEGEGLDAEEGKTAYLWSKGVVPEELGLDFQEANLLESKWCSIHGSKFCEVLLTGRGPRK